MTEILAITTPIYLIILIGYLMTRFGLFGKAEMRTFGKFVVNLALPALLFKALSERRVAEVLNAGYLFAYAFGSLVVIGLGLFWARRCAGRDPLASSFYAMGVSCSNSGYMGYPILLLTLPAVAGVSVALNMIVENLLAIPLLLILAERARGGGDSWATVGKLLGRVAANPLILALLAGLIASLLELRTPQIVVQTVNVLAAASGGVALFVVGGALVGLPVGGLGKEVAPIVFGKLVLHPLCVSAGILMLPSLGLAPLDPALQMAAVLMAAMPMMGIFPTVAQQYGQEDFTAVALLLTTVASFFTLSGLLWAFRHFAFIG